ncbi:hypothetical protein HHL19_35280 [Streptomyces sp. R302]|uniref:hypothetical protein n=1 Tax=unclassified Streptomyces TaxID=2593676 RepID=UPI00145F38A1|nr:MULTISPECIES: hypothetical protein [unclassified Streptomyces]NML55195.1 hypothetical protein [Streptomyces sp. R301]NML83775.1 hypothetical protein [Streptomyces sp. R302]
MSVSAGGGLRHEQNRPPFLFLESSTVRDTGLSFRALGVLAFLADQAEGWNVRSEQLSRGEGREGRAAVRSALRELAEAGYYRLERRRLIGGKHVMGTAISRVPQPEWARQHALFSAGQDSIVPIPVVEQEDGSFRVIYPDGGPGLEVDGAPLETEQPEDKPQPPVAARKAPPAVRTKPVAAPKPSDAGRPWTSPECARYLGIQPAEWRKLVSDGYVPEHTGMKGAKTKVWNPEVVKLVDLKEIHAKRARLLQAASAVADWWWKDAAEHIGPYVGRANGYLAVRGMIEKALRANYTQMQCAKALRKVRQYVPSAQQWQNALSAMSGHKGAVPGGRETYDDAATWGVQTGGGDPAGATFDFTT